MSGRLAARARTAMLRAAGQLAPRSWWRGPVVRRILLIRPDHLGDVLLASAGIARLRATLPEAHLSLLVGPWSLEVAQRGAPVDELLTCEFPGFTRRTKGWPGAPYVELARQARLLRRGRFDLAVVLRPDHWWGALLAVLSGVPTRLGYATPLTEPLLTHTLPLSDAEHSVEQGLRLGEAAASLARAGTDGPSHPLSRQGENATGSGGGVVFRLEQEDEAGADRFLAGHGLGERPLVVVHPGSGAALKGWPIEYWAEAADSIGDRSSADVVISGGAREGELVRAVARAMVRPSAQALDLPLGTLAVLLRRAELVVGADSGPLHLAAAVRGRTLRLYGPTDPARYGPWGPSERHHVARVGLPCSPCGNLVDPPCGARVTPACMTAISVAQVISAQRLLTGRR